MNFKQKNFAITCPMLLFFLSCELPGIKPASTAELPTPLTNKPSTEVKESNIYLLAKTFRSAEW